MKLLRNIDYSSEVYPSMVAAIGNFDGVHLGHQALLSSVRVKAKQLGLPMLVIVFEPQTREFFSKEEAPPRLTSLREKLQILRQFNVDYVCCLRFDKRLAAMSANEFAQSLLFSKLHIKHLYVGHDFRFGCGRVGDVELLQSIGGHYNALVERFPDVLKATQRISSTLIRQALQRNCFEEAATFLGRPYSVCGRVIYGDGLARTWGMPTANLAMSKRRLALRGVFCVQVLCQDGLKYHGVANLGIRPTLGGKKMLLETHIFDFSGSLYGQRIEVFFLHKLRDEVTFSSKDDLITQIRADIEAAKAYFLE